MLSARCCAWCRAATPRWWMPICRPILRRYVDQVAAELTGTRLYFMQSNGGLTEAGSFQGKDAILSGPAGGIVGAARTAEMAGLTRSSASTWAAPRPTSRCMPATSSGRSKPRSPVCGCARR